MNQLTGRSSGLPEAPRRTSLARRGVALAILLIAAWLILTFVIHLVLAVATGLLVVVAVIAAIWAYRVLF
ncbi:MAG: hypothetical protein QOH12_16 [Solirubrobacteraceae bacterium]|jgi:hypothetical protein|nr:hypothetical protein [Solirubrobacteraceae bacterium]